MSNLLPYIPRLGGVSLDEASIRLVLGEIGRKDRGSSRDTTVGSFSVAEVNHALIVISVKHSVVVLVVGICVGSGSRRRSGSVSIIRLSRAESHHRFCRLGKSGVEHLQKSGRVRMVKLTGSELTGFEIFYPLQQLFGGLDRLGTL
jgi:hypothetical protein